MNGLNRNKFKRIMSISLLVSVLLLVMPLIPKAQAAEIVNTWELDRPADTVNFYGAERAENATTTNDASVGLGVQMVGYVDDWHNGIYEGGDGVELRVVSTANTRKGIEWTHVRHGHLYDGFPDIAYMKPTNITGDDSGVWINLPWDVTFYGGGDYLCNENLSGCYNRLWVCSNGFVSFTSDSTSPYPQNIPSETQPNALVAVYWTDLTPSTGSIKYCIIEPPGEVSVVIVWDHVRNKNNGALETFAVIIDQQRYVRTDPLWRGQSKIKFLYKSVSGYPHTVVGLEDQEGLEGYVPGFIPYGEDEIWFTANFMSPTLTRLKIIAWKNDNLAQIKMYDGSLLLRGYNVECNSPQPDTGANYEVALSGGGSLLISTIIGHGNPFGGLMWGGLLLGYDVLHAFAMAAWPAYNVGIVHADLNHNWAYADVSASHSNTYDYPLDATFADTVFWVFNDTNTATHSIDLYAQVEYYSFRDQATKTLSTRVHLTMTTDICNDFSAPKSIGNITQRKGCLDSIDFADMYMISVPNLLKVISVTLIPAYDSNYDLYLFDQGKVCVAKSTRSGNAPEDISYLNYGVGGIYYIKVNRTDWPGHHIAGIYKLSVLVCDPESGGCPYVSVWDGTKYSIDNNILPTSESGNGTDVKDYYRLEQTLISNDGKYSLAINEFEHEHSYIDQMKLLAVDHKSNVHIAVDPYGNVLTYGNPTPPIAAVDNNGNNRLSEISAMDGNVSDSKTYFYGAAGDYLVLDFGRVNSDNAKLILRDDMKCDLCCIDVQVLNSGGQWQTVATVAPRSYWAVEGVNLSPYVVKGQDFKVRLVWTSPHRLDYAGLDTTKQAEYQTTYATLASATHSTLGDVKPQLANSDNTYTELIPGQTIQLDFTLPNNQKEARTYILYTEGHYYTIP